MRNLSLKFYSVQKNEDAVPFLRNGLLAVADGLGGAGSMEHDISQLPFAKDPVKLKKKLINCALPEYDPQKHKWLTPYIDVCFEPLIKEMVHTSAFWGARIAMVRFVYAMKEMPEFYKNMEKGDTRKELSKFIKKGLMDIVSLLGLKPSEDRGRILLPTTLAAISYNMKKETYNVIWTGDSRCYLWTEKYLSQLTSDDIDWMGSINNVFTAREDIVGEIHCYRQNINEPCILFASTDGVSDPYLPDDKYWVEEVLLENIQKSKSMAELKKNLKLHYDAVKYDDASMACVFIGFDSFQDMKTKVSKRTKEILSQKKEYEEKEEKRRKRDGY